ncbi:Sensor histidine kinase RcsC [Usitatibacter rugosus]|uniref:histidine kinase n=1 Tax=Usitatibacter rugosus TaxID=2732067 RepID=A0A6M4GPS3_9PROT|nr:ATP-binding protein [Usitatibacter rugosus]QJR09075.1 Sensor histidine kinase RcsC [Usitatibacter rugosus]
MNSATRWSAEDWAAGASPMGQALAYLSFGVFYFALAWYATDLPVQTRFPHFIWPADGLVLGTLLVAAPRRWPVYLGLVFLANLFFGYELGVSLPRTFVASFVNTAEPALVALGLQQLAKPQVTIDTVKGLAAMLIGMVPLVAGLSIFDALTSYVQFDAPFREQWSVVFVSDMLGMILVAPLILAWSREGWREAMQASRSRLPELVVLYSGLVFTAHYVFGTRSQASGFIPPLAYLCAPFLIWAALGFGLRAATLGLAAFGLICYWHTAQGFGPFSIDGIADWKSILHLQAYLATIVVTTLFAAALLNERQDAAKTTRAWRRRYEAVIRASGNLLYDLDPATGKILWDGDTMAVIGVAPENVSELGPWMSRTHPDDRARLRGVREQLEGGKLRHMAIEYRMQRDDGSYVPVSVNGYMIEEPMSLGPPKKRLIGFVTDVSEKIKSEEDRVRLESQLKQAEKMEAVGHLAGGIAHDFNNILGAILGYGELAQLKAKDEDMKRYLDTIMNAGNRAKSLVTQILSYSRVDTGERIPVLVSPIVQEAVDLIRGSTAGVDVRYEPESGEATVMGDPTRLHQLFMNLCTNAVHAMPDGGVLDVSLAIEVVEHARITRIGELGPGDYVRVTVKDSGHGIAPEVIDRIFEPFFTTKRAGRGTGLGLALVHSVVKEHKGCLDVQSELGKGTAFIVWMPRLNEAAVEAAKPEPALPGRGQVILAVDDEIQVLAALEEMLANLGYEPAGFSSSQEALEAFQADPKRFDAVVSDEVMPEMSGTSLAVELRRMKPSIPIVIATGYGGAGFETRALSAGINRVLKKPYRMTEIAEALAGFFPNR